MCFSRPKPRWEEDIIFRSHAKPRHHHHYHHHNSSRSEMTETIVKTHNRPSVEYVQMPPPKALPAPVSPPPIIVTPTETRIELVSVKEDSPIPRKSRSHVSSSHSSHTRHESSRGGDEVYIERERIRERMPRPPSPPSREEYETYRYVPGGESGSRRRTSVSYDENPRMSTRVVVEREQIRAVDDDGRRRDNYGRYY